MFNSAVPTPSGDYSVLIIDTLEYGAGPRPQGEKAAGSKAKPLVPFEVSEPANVETRMTVYLTKADFCIPKYLMRGIRQATKPNRGFEPRHR